MFLQKESGSIEKLACGILCQQMSQRLIAFVFAMPIQARQGVNSIAYGWRFAEWREAMPEPLTSAQLRPHGWTAALIFRGVDRGLLRARPQQAGACTWWEFAPARGRSWAGVQAEVRQQGNGGQING